MGANVQLRPASAAQAQVMPRVRDGRARPSGLRAGWVSGRPGEAAACAAVVDAAKLDHERDAERADGDPGRPRPDVPGLRCAQRSGHLRQPLAQRRGVVVHDGEHAVEVVFERRDDRGRGVVGVDEREDPAAGADDRELASADLRGRCAAGSVRAARSA
jgi:hypothetical protein